VKTPRKFITAKLSIRKPGSSPVLIICDLFNSHAPFCKKGNITNAHFLCCEKLRWAVCLHQAFLSWMTENIKHVSFYICCSRHGWQKSWVFFPHTRIFVARNWSRMTTVRATCTSVTLLRLKLLRQILVALQSFEPFLLELTVRRLCNLHFCVAVRFRSYFKFPEVWQPTFKNKRVISMGDFLGDTL
jgi:hypothetical protein